MSAQMVNVLSNRPAPSRMPSLTSAQQQSTSARLAETRAWCTGRTSSLPVASRFRTPDLAPDLEEESALPALEAALEGLALQRRTALAATDSKERAVAGAGRLLVCELDMSIGSGEAEAASEGFFDVDDRPPWDLWLVCFGKTRPAQPDEPIACLIAWVPDSLCGQADAGVRASRARCIHWVDELGGAFADQLRPESLVG